MIKSFELSVNTVGYHQFTAASLLSKHMYMQRYGRLCYKNGETCASHCGTVQTSKNTC